MADNKNYEVAKHEHAGKPDSTREKSFGGAPGVVNVTGGRMHTFGHKINDGVWPPSPTSVDSKTGYPENFEKQTKERVKLRRSGSHGKLDGKS